MRRSFMITRRDRSALAFLSTAAVLTAITLSGSTGNAGAPPSARPDAGLASGERVHLSHRLVARFNDLGDDRVVTAGLGVKTAELSSFVLRSYEADTGTLISEDEFALSVDPDTAEAVAAGGGRVYAIGSGLTSAGAFSLLVRAYDARSGELLWIDELNPAANPRHRTGSTNAAPFRDRSTQAFARPQSRSLFTVRAVDEESGQVLWQDEFLPSEEDLDTGEASGSTSQDAGRARGFSLMVRTYEDATNKLLWEDQFDPVTRKERIREKDRDVEPDLPVDTKEPLQVVLRARR